MVTEEISAPINDIKKFLRESEDFRIEGPRISSIIDHISENQITSSRSISLYDLFIVLYLHIVSKTIYPVLEAQKLLKQLVHPGSQPSKRNLHNKIKELIRCLEKKHSIITKLLEAMEPKSERTSCDTICKDDDRILQSGEFFKQAKYLEEMAQSADFINAEAKLRNALKEYVDELDKLYEDLLELKVHYIGEREERSFVTSFHELAMGTILVGAAALAFKSSEIALVGAAATFTIGMAWKSYHPDQNNSNDQDVMKRLGTARSNILEAKILVERFRTEIGIIDDIGRYDRNNLDRILRNGEKGRFSFQSN